MPFKNIFSEVFCTDLLPWCRLIDNTGISSSAPGLGVYRDIVKNIPFLCGAIASQSKTTLSSCSYVEYSISDWGRKNVMSPVALNDLQHKPWKVNLPNGVQQGRAIQGLADTIPRQLNSMFCLIWHGYQLWLHLLVCECIFIELASILEMDTF